jgi:hypothetical protein
METAPIPVKVLANNCNSLILMGKMQPMGYAKNNKKKEEFL